MKAVGIFVLLIIVGFSLGGINALTIKTFIMDVIKLAGAGLAAVGLIAGLIASIKN